MKLNNLRNISLILIILISLVANSDISKNVNEDSITSPISSNSSNKLVVDWNNVEAPFFATPWGSKSVVTFNGKTAYRFYNPLGNEEYVDGWQKTVNQTRNMRISLYMYYSDYSYGNTIIELYDANQSIIFRAFLTNIDVGTGIWFEHTNHYNYTKFPKNVSTLTSQWWYFEIEVKYCNNRYYIDARAKGEVENVWMELKDLSAINNTDAPIKYVVGTNGFWNRNTYHYWADCIIENYEESIMVDWNNIEAPFFATPWGSNSVVTFDGKTAYRFYNPLGNEEYVDGWQKTVNQTRNMRISLYMYYSDYSYGNTIIELYDANQSIIFRAFLTNIDVGTGIWFEHTNHYNYTKFPKNVSTLTSQWWYFEIEVKYCNNRYYIDARAKGEVENVWMELKDLSAINNTDAPIKYVVGTNGFWNRNTYHYWADCNIEYTAISSIYVPVNSPVLQISPILNSTNQAILNWSEVSGATSYLLYRSTADISSVEGLTPIYSGLSLMYVDMVNQSIKMYYTVVALIGNDTSNNSNVVSFTYSYTPPPTNNDTTDPGNEPQDPEFQIGISNYGYVLICMFVTSLVLIKKRLKTVKFE